MRSSRTIITTAALSGGAFLVPGTLHAGDRVTVESVSDYKQLFPDGSADLPNAIPNGNGFYNTITIPFPFTVRWEKEVAYTDDLVWDVDFLDPQRTGNSIDADQAAFDRPGVAIAYFSGHGIGQVGQGTCTSSAQCTSPPAGASGNGVCRTSPPSNRFCVYSSPRALVTSSVRDKHGHLAFYGTGGTALGEGNFGNIWGAGMNGGINLAVLDISHGVTAMFWNEELTAAFAGLHLLATIMPINGDTASVSDRGSTFAIQSLINPNGSVATAWMETLNSLPQQGFWGCGGTVNDFTYGGGHGINGCGCNFIMSVDSSMFWSNWHINNETWVNLANDGYDGDGAAKFSWRALCNYDSHAYPWAS